MDTSETYIKMCEKAREIQCCVKKEFVGNPEYVFIKIGEGTIDYPFYMCWLPRQDQLQEMLYQHWEYDETYVTRHIVALDDFQEWVLNVAPDSITKMSGLEQLWLAFVMKEKYGKIWDGKNWIEA